MLQLEPKLESHKRGNHTTSTDDLKVLMPKACVMLGYKLQTNKEMVVYKKNIEESSFIKRLANSTKIKIDSLEKTLMLGGIGGQEEKGTTEDEMAGWHHWLNGRESQWTPGVGDGQGGLECCDSWGRKESDMTEWLIWSDLIYKYIRKTRR